MYGAKINGLYIYVSCLLLQRFFSDHSTYFDFCTMLFNQTAASVCQHIYFVELLHENRGRTFLGNTENVKCYILTHRDSINPGQGFTGLQEFCPGEICPGKVFAENF